MKHTITNRIATLLFLAVGLAGCSKEETLPGTPDATRSPMSITVADSGYASTDKLHTRAIEKGYITEFSAGDRIGLYIVKSDNAYATENLCLTLTDMDDGTLTWQTPIGKELYEDATTKNFRYFAYYPYQDNLNGTPASAATDATTFFADVASKWTLATDQSAYADYTANDLMTGIGTLGSKQLDGSYPLSFAMTHAMALVVIETPRTNYTVKDAAGNPLSPYSIPTSYATFSGFTPYSLDGGIYRYLVKPSQSGATGLAGSFSDANDIIIKEFSVQQNNINPASYARYKVDGAAVTEATHTLQVGDFYLRDGSLVGKDVSLTSEQKSACIGIVYWVGNIKDDNYGLLDKKFPSGTHALVACKHLLTDPDVANQHAMTWTYGLVESTSIWLAAGTWLGYIRRPTEFTNILEKDKMQGYINTIALKEFNKELESPTSKNRVKPIYALANFVKSNPAPTSSSGWYWPSVTELKTMCWGQGSTTQGIAGREMLDSQFQKVGGQSSLGRHWSSTEYLFDGSLRNYRDAWDVDFSNGYPYHLSKDNTPFSVRPVLAF